MKTMNDVMTQSWTMPNNGDIVTFDYLEPMTACSASTCKCTTGQSKGSKSNES